MTPAPLSLRAFGHRVLVALVVCCVLATALWTAVDHIENAKVADIRTVPIPASLLRAGGNYLIIGSDTRSFVSSKADEQAFGSKSTQGGQRSDTIMVAHLDPGQKTGLLVSFPRDLWVSIPGHGMSKINAAFDYGGPRLAIETIEDNFDVPISHYLEVDFAGFRSIVNAIGTVPIYFPTPARDHNSGLSILTAGCQTLNGDQALAYVRSRYYQYYANGRWQYDPTSDLGRIKRQQYFIRSLAHAAIHSVLSDPYSFGKADKVVNATTKSLTRDKQLDLGALRPLLYAFRDTNPADFPMYTLPSTPSVIDRQDVLLLDSAQAAPTLARLRGTPPESTSIPKISPSSVRLAVENGSGVTGAAGLASSQLQTDGFRIGARATDADRSDYQVTEVRYAPGAEKKARLVRAYLAGAGKLVALGAAPSGVDVVVVLGRDFQHVTPPASATSTTTAATAAPTHPAGTGAGNTRPAPTGSTTTTGPPANPGGAMPEAGCLAAAPLTSHR